MSDFEVSFHSGWALSVPPHTNHHIARMKIIFSLQRCFLVPFHSFLPLLKNCVKTPLLTANDNAIQDLDLWQWVLCSVQKIVCNSEAMIFLVNVSHVPIFYTLPVDVRCGQVVFWSKSIFSSNSWVVGREFSFKSAFKSFSWKLKLSALWAWNFFL